MKNSFNNNFIKKIKILILRFLSIIFAPIFALIPLETKTYIYDLFPNNIYRLIALICIVIFLFAWFIGISHIIYRIENNSN